LLNEVPHTSNNTLVQTPLRAVAVSKTTVRGTFGELLGLFSAPLKIVTVAAQIIAKSQEEKKE